MSGGASSSPCSTWPRRNPNWFPNTAASFRACCTRIRHSARLNFVSVEKHPLARDDLEAALAPFEELHALSAALYRAWPPPIAGFHRLHFEGGRIALTLIFGDATECLPQLEARADALFL